MNETGGTQVVRRRFRVWGELTAWALYDLANQFFVVNIVSLYFVRWLTGEKALPEIVYSLTYGISTAVVAVVAPAMGTYADRFGQHRRLLIACTLVSALFTVFLGTNSPVWLMLVYFAIANATCQQASIFYNSLMRSVTGSYSPGVVSGMGKVFGYAGAILAIGVSKPLMRECGYPPVFLLTGVLFALFALPCMLWVREPDIHDGGRERSMPAIGAELRATLRMLARSEHAALTLFFRACFLGLCAINTVMLFVSVYAHIVLEMDEAAMADFMVVGTSAAMAGSIAFGIFSDRCGGRRAMFAVFMLWMCCLSAAVAGDYHWRWLIGILAGLSLGGTWVVSRSVLIEICPPQRSGEIFGMFALVGYLSAIIGPLLWSALVLVIGGWGAIGYRISLAVFIIFLAAAAALLRRMPAAQFDKKSGQVFT
ncbi:MAG: MFS transporter [Candidatus Omnitrophica bacterium]|nr:MFS transporter [Candidatus Omnitrophota bacterium]